jgi:hypothetical protein
LKVAFRESFLKDLRAIKDQDVRRRIREIIDGVEQADKPTDISNLKKLKGEGPVLPYQNWRAQSRTKNRNRHSDLCKSPQSERDL